MEIYKSYYELLNKFTNGFTKESGNFSLDSNSFTDEELDEALNILLEHYDVAEYSFDSSDYANFEFAGLIDDATYELEEAYENALNELEELDLDTTDYDYYRQNLDDIYYKDKISLRNGESGYSNFNEILEDAKRTAQN